MNRARLSLWIQIVSMRVLPPLFLALGLANLAFAKGQTGSPLLASLLQGLVMTFWITELALSTAAAAEEPARRLALGLGSFAILFGLWFWASFILSGVVVRESDKLPWVMGGIVVSLAVIACLRLLLPQALRFQIEVVAVWFNLFFMVLWLFLQFNLELAFMQKWFAFIAQGVGITVYVSLLSICAAIVLALFGALARLSKNPIFFGISTFYISFFRGTPLLVQIYLIYLGLPQLRHQLGQWVVLPAIPAGILALSLNYGAYMTEIFRAGIQSIGHGQTEAAYALGMTYGQTMRRIILPQALRLIIPPVGNEFIAMLKDSSLLSTVGVWELLFRGQKIGRQYFRSIETLAVAAALYWIVTIIFQAIQSRVEESLAKGEKSIAHL